MKNCFDCKHCKTIRIGYLTFKELKEYQPSEHILLEQSDNLAGDLVGKCGLGFNERMRDFRKEHGSKTREQIEGDRSLDMECHDYSDGVKILDSMLESTKKLLEHLNNHNLETLKENTDPI